MQVESRLLDNQLRGKLSQKISSITISGEQLTAVSSSALQVRSLSIFIKVPNQRDVAYGIMWLFPWIYYLVW